MKIAIVYGSVHGTTRKIAEYLKAELNEQEITLYNLAHSTKIDISTFDTIIIGGSIHSGKLNKKVSQFIKKNLIILLQKRIALFMCAMNQLELENEFNRGFPELLRHHAISQQQAGGELLYEKMNCIEAFITKKITGIRSSVSTIDYPAIDQLIVDIKTK